MKDANQLIFRTKSHSFFSEILYGLNLARFEYLVSVWFSQILAVLHIKLFTLLSLQKIKKKWIGFFENTRPIVIYPINLQLVSLQQILKLNLFANTNETIVIILFLMIYEDTDVMYSHTVFNKLLQSKIEKIYFIS